MPNYAQVGRFRTFCTDISQVGTVLNSVAHFCTIWHKSFSAVENKYNFISDTVVHSFGIVWHKSFLVIKNKIRFIIWHSCAHYGTF